MTKTPSGDKHVLTDVTKFPECYAFHDTSEQGVKAYTVIENSLLTHHIYIVN